MNRDDIANMTEDQLIRACELHIEAYPNCSDCSRLLEQLLDKHTKQRNILKDLTK